MTSVGSSNGSMRVLIIEDNHRHRQMLKEVLYGKCEVDCAVHFVQAKEKLKKQQYDLVLLDLMLPQRDNSPVVEDGSLGLALLRIIRENEPLLPVVVISALQNTSTTLQILRFGIADFIMKDELEEQLPIILKRTELIRQGRVDNLLLRHYQHADRDGKFIYADKSMKAIDEQISLLANEHSSVLLLGESGTGKEVIAREIHRRGSRAGDPFIDINCGAIPDHLLESELFGHEKGAFTGADRMKNGLIELAHNGTIFLDEIADLSSNMQVKLLRFLQERIFRRIGGVKNLAVDVRIIAATNKNLTKEMESGRFREDLYYRLSGVNIDVPPLRNRKADIELLTKQFLNQSTKGEGIVLEPGAIKIIQRFPWPGNVRELGSFVQRLLIVQSGKRIAAKTVSQMLSQNQKKDSERATIIVSEQQTDNLLAVEKATIERVLASSTNHKIAAKRLGIAESTLRRKKVDHLIGKASKQSSKQVRFRPTVTRPKQNIMNREERLLESVYGMSTFTTSDAVKMLGTSSMKTVIGVLNTLIQQKRVARVQKGVYKAQS